MFWNPFLPTWRQFITALIVGTLIGIISIVLLAIYSPPTVVE